MRGERVAPPPLMLGGVLALLRGNDDTLAALAGAACA